MEMLWNVAKPDPDTVQRIQNTLHCHPATACSLVNRGITSPTTFYPFLNPSLKNLGQPFSIRDMEAAVERIYKAIIDREKILIFGDYDVDGITATAILTLFFRNIEADVTYYIPHRISEGYGLKPYHIPNVALSRGVHLIITADCGSGNHDAVLKAQKAGIDVIITDHHLIPERIPSAKAVLNPKRSDCDSGLEHLAGVGVAFYLLIGLRMYLRDKNFWKDQSEPVLKDLCDLVALGTVADRVPLVDENRILTRTGLKVINSVKRTGVTALMKEGGLHRNPLRSEDIAFSLAPRLNAAGRMDHAEKAVHLLTESDPAEAGRLAANLSQMNRQRQETEKQILLQIEQLLDKRPGLLGSRSLILADPQWHEGVLGIVASRLTKKYFRPAILLSTGSGIGKGSARSISGVDLYSLLGACSTLLESFGGHSMAAGLAIRPDKIDLFRETFENAAMKDTLPDHYQPELPIDHELDLNDISDNLVDELESLEPFGAGNPEPLYMAKNVSMLSSRIVGKHHCQMVLSRKSMENSNRFNAIQFNVDPNTSPVETFEKVAFRLRWNRWNGKKSIQLIIEEAEF